MKSIKIKCPAKINLTLEIVNKREDGFHNIKSIMQTISLYDYLSINVEDSNNTEIILNGNSKEIPYNEKNLVYKAAQAFFDKTGIKNKVISIYIEKHIPIAAGLAGGSTDGAGTFFGINELFQNPLSRNELHELCSQLGSDLNVCLEGGTLLATSRGENIEKLPTPDYTVTLIKPKNLGISAKEAYTKYAHKEFKPKYDNTEKMIDSIKSGRDIRPYLYNDLEYAIFDDYKELQYIKNTFPAAIMSGSGSTYFILDEINKELSNDYDIIKGLYFLNDGVCVDRR